MSILNEVYDELGRNTVITEINHKEKSITMNTPHDEKADKGLTLYLAGPMSGIENFNFPAFHRYAKALRAQGFTVINPADKETLQGTDLPDYTQLGNVPLGDVFREDFRLLVDVDGIAMMPGWENSPGARAEFLACTLMWKLRLRIMDAQGDIYLQEFPYDLTIRTELIADPNSRYLLRPQTADVQEASANG